MSEQPQNAAEFIDDLSLPVVKSQPWPEPQRDSRRPVALTWLYRFGALAVFGAYVAALVLLWRGLEPRIPDEVTLRLFGRTVTAHNLHQRISDSGVWLLLLLPFVLYLEVLIVGWPKAALRRILFERNSSIRMDLGCIAADQAQLLRIVGRVMTFGLSASAGIWIHDTLSRTTGVQIGLTALPYPVQIAGYFLVYTFCDYWAHRLDHTKLFWPLHRYHHSTEDFSIVTALRQHPAAFTAIFVINMPMAILGAPVEQMITINLFVTIIGLVIHSGIDSDFGWFGRYVLQSPVHHRLHHILDISDGVGHYGLLPLSDRLFGTWMGDADQSLVIGVSEPYHQGFGFWKDAVRDYVEFWQGWWRLATKMAASLVRPWSIVKSPEV